MTHCISNTIYKFYMHPNRKDALLKPNIRFNLDVIESDLNTQSPSFSLVYWTECSKHREGSLLLTSGHIKPRTMKTKGVVVPDSHSYPESSSYIYSLTPPPKQITLPFVIRVFAIPIIISKWKLFYGWFIIHLRSSNNDFIVAGPEDIQVRFCWWMRRVGGDGGVFNYLIQFWGWDADLILPWWLVCGVFWGFGICGVCGIRWWLVWVVSLYKKCLDKLKNIDIGEGKFYFLCWV